MIKLKQKYKDSLLQLYSKNPYKKPPDVLINLASKFIQDDWERIIRNNIENIGISNGDVKVDTSKINLSIEFVAWVEREGIPLLEQFYSYHELMEIIDSDVDEKTD